MRWVGGWVGGLSRPTPTQPTQALVVQAPHTHTYTHTHTHTQPLPTPTYLLRAAFSTFMRASSLAMVGGWVGGWVGVLLSRPTQRKRRTGPSGGALCGGDREAWLLLLAGAGAGGCVRGGHARAVQEAGCGCEWAWAWREKGCSGENLDGGGAAACGEVLGPWTRPARGLQKVWGRVGRCAGGVGWGGKDREQEEEEEEAGEERRGEERRGEERRGGLQWVVEMRSKRGFAPPPFSPSTN